MSKFSSEKQYIVIFYFNYFYCAITTDVPNIFYIFIFSQIMAIK